MKFVGDFIVWTIGGAASPGSAKPCFLLRVCVLVHCGTVCFVAIFERPQQTGSFPVPFHMGRLLLIAFTITLTSIDILVLIRC